MGEQWPRVHGPDLDPGNKKRYKANTQIRKSDTFRAACEKVGISPTQRQASKFRRKRGLAYEGINIE